MRVIKIEPIRTVSDLIRESLLTNQTTDQIVETVALSFPEKSYDSILNQIGVVRHQLRKSKLLEPINHRIHSRHKLTIRALLKGKTNSEILKILKKHYPNIPDKIHKQRICEYRWYLNTGRLNKD